jgi:23S rRNA U2552 (ribose-2'-O)-methylase RlmE/FtsJ
MMPIQSTIIAVDIIPVKPIRGVKTFVEDITTSKCRATVKKVRKYFWTTTGAHPIIRNPENKKSLNAFVEIHNDIKGDYSRESDSKCFL